MHKNNYAVILCGGSGTRLWPLSRTSSPKQLLALNGKESLLQQTAKRLSIYIDPSNIYTVTNETNKFEVMEKLRELFPQSVENVLAEPFARNTLPAIAWATHQIYLHNKDAIVGVFASDHAIEDERAFLGAWKAAEHVAKDDYLVLLGIKPHDLVTGYGYIKANQSSSLSNLMSAYQVAEFVEKPDLVKAQQFISQGYLWNSGMFVFKASTLIYFLQKYQLEIYNKICSITSESLSKSYKELPNISMDHGLAELLAKNAEKIAVVPVDMGWSDLGSWDSIYARHQKDIHSNVIHGEVINLDTQNSLIWSESRLVATLGLNNLVVIQTADATLICDKNRTEEIKTLVEEINIHRPTLTEIHQTVYRPWGSYTVLEESVNYKIKRIIVNPNQKLSMQMHNYRSEHWVVVSGIASISNNDNEYNLEKNQSTYISQGQRHRLANNTNELLIIIEVQCGQYVGEDDIVRFNDNYGRVKNND